MIFLGAFWGAGGYGFGHTALDDDVQISRGSMRNAGRFDLDLVFGFGCLRSDLNAGFSGGFWS